MKCIMTDIPKADIKEMVNHLYGACKWELLLTGELVVYPTSKGKVSIKEDRPPRSPCNFCGRPDAGDIAFFNK